MNIKEHAKTTTHIPANNEIKQEVLNSVENNQMYPCQFQQEMLITMIA